MADINKLDSELDIFDEKEEKEEKKDKNSPHDVPIGQTKHGGTTNILKKMKIGKMYTNTMRYTIIAASGCGKTSLALDLIYFWIEPFENIIYINTHFDDNNVQAFEQLCNEAGIDFYNVDASGSDIQIPKVKNSVWVIDDTYTSSKRNQAVEVLIKKLWNKGRWNGDHAIYIAHLDKYLPPETLHNATAIFVDRAYEKFPITEKIPQNETGRFWFKVEHPLDPRYGEIQKMVIDLPASKNEMIKRLEKKKDKLPKEENKKKPDDKLIRDIGLQGNENALKAATFQAKKRYMIAPTKATFKNNYGGDNNMVSSKEYGSWGENNPNKIILDERRFN